MNKKHASILSKKCLVCDNIFYKHYSKSLKDWNERTKYCSRKCLHNSKKNIPTWNKGIPWSDDIKKTISSKLKGKPNIHKGKNMPEWSGENHPNWKEKTIVLCKQCNADIKLPPWRLKNKNYFCNSTCYHKWHRGTNSPVWTDNYKQRFRQRIMELPEYVQWRNSVFRRDDYKCVQCETKGYIEADHIKPFFKIIQENGIIEVLQARNCTALWDISNGRTLCRSCHRKTDTFGRRGLKKPHKN